MHYYGFICRIFFVITLNMMRISAAGEDQEHQLINAPLPPPPLSSAEEEEDEALLPGKQSSPVDVIVQLRANFYNISAFVPNHPGGAAVLRLVNGQDIAQYIEGRKCVLGVCHRHRYAYQVLSQFEMRSDVLVGVKGKWYNISAFVPNHPGGPLMLKAVNGQRDVEQYLEGRKCVFGICHRHSNAYEVLNQLEMFSLSTAVPPPHLAPSPTSIRRHTKNAMLAPNAAPNSSSLHLSHLAAAQKINNNTTQKQPTQPALWKNGSQKGEKPKEGGTTRGNGRTEFAFASDLSHQQKEVNKGEGEQQFGKQLREKTEENGQKASNANRTTTATEESHQKQRGKSSGNKTGTAEVEKPKNDGKKEGVVFGAPQNGGTKGHQQSIGTKITTTHKKGSNENGQMKRKEVEQHTKGGHLQEEEGEEKRQKRAKNAASSSPAVAQSVTADSAAHHHSSLANWTTLSSPVPPPVEEQSMRPRGTTEARRRRMPHCLFVRRSEQWPHTYECA